LAYQQCRRSTIPAYLQNAVQHHQGDPRQSTVSDFEHGNSLLMHGQAEAALASYDRAIAIQPDHADAWSNRGAALQYLGKKEAALASHDRAVAICPDHAVAWFNRGLALQNLGQTQAALASYDRAIALRPDYANAYYNRGVTLQNLGQTEAALASYDCAIAIQPDHADAHYNRGLALQDLGHTEAALISFDRSIALRPNQADVHYTRGNALKSLGHTEAALASYERAIAVRPDDANAYYNRGVVLQELGQTEAAVTSFDHAIALGPAHAGAHLNRSLLLLRRGEFARAWPAYEWRWKKEQVAKFKRDFPQPLWLGETSLHGKTILLHFEQGLGDTLQFCRYAKHVAGLGARVIMEVPKPLIGLLRTLEGVAGLVESGSTLPVFDCHCPLLSLPLAFKTDLSNIPNAVPYLRSAPEDVARWTAKLGAKGNPRVGLVWSGNPDNSDDHNRSIELSRLVAQLPPGFEYVSLQLEVRDRDWQTLQKNTGIRHFGDELNDFTDTAALCELMDVVVSVDTSVAHLAGAMGKATWLMLPTVADWRWLLHRPDSPWYPSMRLYRQETAGDWDGVLGQIRADFLRCFRSSLKQEKTPESRQPSVGRWPNDFEARAKLCLELKKQGTLPQQIADEVVKGLCNAGEALHKAGRLEEAETSYRQAISLLPDSAKAHNDFGIFLKATKRIADAETSYRYAIELEQDLIVAHYNLGNLLLEVQRLGEAEESYRRVLALKPDFGEAHNKLGRCLKHQGRLIDAEASFRQALELEPDFVDVRYSLGVVLDNSNRLADAEACFRKVIEINPSIAEAHDYLGDVLRRSGRLAEAEGAYRRALALSPDSAEMRSRVGLALLSLGKYDEAWSYFESRYDPNWKESVCKVPSLPFPQWQGESLARRSLLLVPEQGYGDYIQFVRYAALLKERGLSRLSLVCAEPLKALLETMDGVDSVILDSEPFPPHDFWTFPLSLPLRFGTTLGSIPNRIPYLCTLPKRVKQWRVRLPGEQFLVGLVWKGNPDHGNDANRSLPGLSTLAPLWSVPGVTFISLQKGPGEDEALLAPATQPILGLGSEIDDFADTAAIVSQLDLVICVDTAIAHVAGALGRPCWLLLAAQTTDWRWLLERPDSPWYPNAMRLFRQSAPGDWGEVISQVKIALETLVRTIRDRRPTKSRRVTAS
jgi:hypothetical protein